MAQNNPVNESASYSTTGSANGPLNTNSSSNTTTNPAPTTSTSSDSKLKDAGIFAKNMLAAAHGAGEKVRGEFNSGVDGAFHESEGVAKNRRVADAGDGELATGEFAESTKNREGAVPGDYEKRRS